MHFTAGDDELEGADREGDAVQCLLCTAQQSGRCFSCAVVRVGWDSV